MGLEANIVRVDKVACARDQCKGWYNGSSADIQEAPLSEEEFIGGALEEAGNDHVGDEKEAAW